MNQVKKQDTSWKEYEKFKNDYNLTLKNNKLPQEIVKSIMNEKGFTVNTLQEKSKIDARTIHRMRSGEIKTRKRIMEYTPHEKTIVAFCIACDLDMLMAITLMESYGLSFKKTNKVHYAYCYLIINCRGKAISECNEILKNFEIEEDDLLRDDDTGE